MYRVYKSINKKELQIIDPSNPTGYYKINDEILVKKVNHDVFVHDDLYLCMTTTSYRGTDTYVHCANKHTGNKMDVKEV